MRARSIALFLCTAAVGAARPCAAEPQECSLQESRVFGEFQGPDGAFRVTDVSITSASRRWDACSGLPLERIAAVTQTFSGIVIGAHQQLFHFDGRAFTPIRNRTSGFIRALESNGDDLWVGTTEGLFSVAGEEADRVDGPLGRRSISALRYDGEGALHIGTEPRGWWKWQNGAQRVRGSELVGCFERLGDTVRPEPPGSSCTAGGPAAPNGPQHVTALETHENCLYAGTFDEGLWRRCDGNWQRIAGVPSMVDVVTSDGADLWVGTPRGLFRIEEGFAVYMPLGLPSERVHDVLRSRDGQLWIATSQGIASWDGATTRQLDTAQGLPSRIVYALAETEDGALWGGTDNGAFRWGPTDLLIFTRERGTLPHDWVTSLVADGNAVLAGTYDAGVVRLTADGRSEVIAGLDLAWVNPHGIARQGAEWFVSTLGGGLLRRTPDGGVVSVTALPSSDVTAVSWFGGELWVGTRNGLARPAL